jgi:hypothetical protein
LDVPQTMATIRSMAARAFSGRSEVVAETAHANH